MIVEVRAVEPFFKNGYVLGCEDTREAVLVDPGDEVADLLAAADVHGLQVRYILLTHAHLDHISGVARARAAVKAPVWLHRADDFLYRAAVQQGIAFGFKIDRQPPVDSFYEEGRALRFGRYAAVARHTPGHSPGGVCLVVAREDGSDRVLVVGDTLFAGSIGRTDLPGGDMTALLASITGVLFSYPDDTVVYSGHGPSTTIGQERRTNPFLRGV
jgi:glyoxylase-like metal-dependent hydrolase (beta-lactamase superfamily II)